MFCEFDNDDLQRLLLLFNDFVDIFNPKDFKLLFISFSRIFLYQIYVYINYQKKKKKKKKEREKEKRRDKIK